jgi:hypothetical protein
MFIVFFETASTQLLTFWLIYSVIPVHSLTLPIPVGVHTQPDVTEMISNQFDDLVLILCNRQIHNSDLFSRGVPTQPLIWTKVT